MRGLMREKQSTRSADACEGFARTQSATRGASLGDGQGTPVLTATNRSCGTSLVCAVVSGHMGVRSRRRDWARCRQGFSTVKISNRSCKPGAKQAPQRLDTPQERSSTKPNRPHLGGIKRLWKPLELSVVIVQICGTCGKVWP